MRPEVLKLGKTHQNVGIDNEFLNRTSIAQELTNGVASN
jgi:hypothetical protein